MRWWVTEAKSFRPVQLASWYVGPALFFAGLHGMYSLRIAAAVVCVFGIAETVQLMARRVLTPVQSLLSVLGHLLVWVPYANRYAPMTDTWLHSCTLMFGVLGVFAATRTWPYTLSPLVALGLGLAAGVVTTT